MHTAASRARSHFESLEPRRVLSAGLIAYEGFDYAAGSLNAQNGGAGWSGAWAVTGTGSGVETGSMSHTGLTTAGGKLHLWDVDGTSATTATRNLSLNNPVGQAHGTIWVSFIADKDSTYRDFAVSFDGLLFKASGSGNWTVKTPNTSAQTTAVAGTTQTLFLARIDFAAASDKVYVWANPSLASEPATATAALSFTDTTGFTFDSISIASGPFGNSAQGGRLDEIRIGDTFASVKSGTTAMTGTGWYADLETGNTSQFAGTEGQTGGRSVVTSVEGGSPRDGSYALKNVVQRSLIGSAKRSEAFRYNLGWQGAPGEEWWYGFSVFVPTSWVDDPGEPIFIAQMHVKPDIATEAEGWRTPFLGFKVDGSNFTVTNWYDEARDSGDQAYMDSHGGVGPTMVSRSHTLGAVTKGQWNDIVFRANWDYRTAANGGAGQLEIWLNGTRVVNQGGANCYNDVENQMYMKVGLYMPGYDSNDAASYTVYHDAIRAARGTAGFSAVVPAGARAAGGAGNVVTMSAFSATRLLLADDRDPLAI